MKTLKRNLLLVLFLGCASGFLKADPPPPPPSGTTCPMVQCMVITAVNCINANTVDVFFSTLNWFNTNRDNGVNEIRIIPTSFSKFQVTMLQAGAPAGWAVASFSADSVVFTGPPISESWLCDTCASGPLGNCGNILSGFRIRITDISAGDCFTANWRHYSQGIDNGDNMNFGSMGWCVNACAASCGGGGSCNIQETYSNTAFPSSFFAIPTLSQWGLIVFALLLISMGMVFVYKRQRVLAIAGGAVYNQRVSNWNASLFFRVFAIVLLAAIACITAAYFYFGHITMLDIAGTILSAAIVAYMTHLWMMKRKDD